MTTSTTPTKVTATELARNLSDILSRAHYRGERFIILRNGEPVATIGPPVSLTSPTLAELAERLRDVPSPDPEFWEELKEIRRSQPKVKFPDWP